MTAASAPGDQALLATGKDDNDWLIPGKTYAGSRTTGLTEINISNVATLAKAWVTEIKDDGPLSIASTPMSLVEFSRVFLERGRC